MFPGFVSIYRDDSKKVHLYFFPGIDDNLMPIYRDIDMGSIKVDYTYKQHPDKSIEFIFNKNITSVSYSLNKISNGETVSATISVGKH